MDPKLDAVFSRVINVPPSRGFAEDTVLKKLIWPINITDCNAPWILETKKMSARYGQGTSPGDQGLRVLSGSAT